MEYATHLRPDLLKVCMYKYACSLHTQMNDEIGLLRGSSEGCVCQTSKIKRAVHLACFLDEHADVCDLPTERAKYMEQRMHIDYFAHSCDLPKLKLIAAAIFASLFSTFCWHVLT